MEGHFDQRTFTFLKGLARSNNRDWFRAHKASFEADVKEPFLDFISDVGPQLRKISPNLLADPKPVGGSLFRIYRDVRFSKDNRRRVSWLVLRARVTRRACSLGFRCGYGHLANHTVAHRDDTGPAAHCP